MEDHRVKAVEIIQKFAKAGVSLHEDGQGRLIYQPGSPVTAEMVHQLKLYKREILDYLEQPWWCDDHVERNVKPVQDWCPMYQHPKAWKSIYGDHLICGTCYPPVSEKVMAEWIVRKGESELQKPGDNGDSSIENGFQT